MMERRCVNQEKNFKKLCSKMENENCEKWVAVEKEKCMGIGECRVKDITTMDAC